MKAFSKGYIKKMGNKRTGKRVCMWECMGSRLVGRARNRWIDTVDDCWKNKSGLNIGQERRMVHDRNKQQGFVKGGRSGWDVAWGMNP